MEEFEKLLKQKKIMLASIGCNIPDHFQYLDWKTVLSDLFGELLIFSIRDNYFKYGKEKTNELFIEYISKEKPDFLLMSMSYDEFEPETLWKIKEVSPNTKTIHYFGDDDWRFDDWSRYYAPFFDYILVTEKETSEYKKDKIKNVYFLWGINPKRFRPLNLEKKYDITFIGAPIVDRPDYINFLLENNIKVYLFSDGWEAYPKLKSLNGGYLTPEDYIKTINQTKINLSFSKGFLPGSKGGQVKLRICEVLACKSFVLTENSSTLKYFFNDHQKISFLDKKELLDKINYYLKNEGEREKLTEKIYKKVIKDYNIDSIFKKFFKKILSEKDYQKNSFILKAKTSCHLFKEDLELPKEEILKKIAKFNYVSFEIGKQNISKYKDFFQIYSLEKSKKEISCCDYYVYSKGLENYLLFSSKKAFNFLKKEDFSKLLNLNQITVTKKYFFENMQLFKEIANGGVLDFLDNSNTVFVSIPLVSVEKIRILEYDAMKKAFQMKFKDKLYSLMSQKKLLLSPYPYHLILTSIYGKKFIIKHLLDSFFNKQNIRRLFQFKKK